ncbi:MAG TPA: calcium-binding EGF-like domain-containing protein [Flavipsychrobacter sp.]
MRLFRGMASAALFVTAAFSIVLYTACKKEKYPPVPDKCAGIVCKNNGVCIQGECDCTAGYSGEFCDKKNIAPYIGNWSVTQEVVSVNGKPVSGRASTYTMTISEDASGVTILNFSNFMGEPGFDNVLGRIGMTIAIVKNHDDLFVETEVIAHPSNFLFKRYQALGQSGKQLLKGEGSINSLGTQMSGEFYVVYADTAGPAEERVKFSAEYIN